MSKQTILAAVRLQDLGELNAEIGRLHFLLRCCLPFVRDRCEQTEYGDAGARNALEWVERTLKNNAAEQPQGEPVALTAIGILRDDGDGGLVPEWILEGGTAELWEGAVLLIADEDQKLCAEDGHCKLYRHPPETPTPTI
ncbi:hypothetical protein [Pseudomonas chlororaphis]|uniref:hypothetical protein n=1 Tax=Pseudomonas chlororaphis TaxID=587753 RepID=UPI001B30BD00|nr:hypothetical protein [Pseudomonas chlororaphis]MBP5057687.1 hypothetical protein [Pseudomonas chlororaphis]MBP5141438.1 hypothetical protein [Pseudomonas chlororaphis]QTU03109.1 hypothetical protein HUT26_28845 [Pseudomonas chlororaphis]